MDSSKAVKKDHRDLTLIDLLVFIAKYKYIAIICVLAGLTAGAIKYYISVNPGNGTQYYASATIFVTSKNADGSYNASGSAESPSVSDIIFAQSLVPTTAELAKSNYVLNLVIAEGGLYGITPETLRASVICDTIEGTAFIEIICSRPEEWECIAAVNALADILPSAMIDKLDIGGANVINYADRAYPVYQSFDYYLLIYPLTGIAAGLCAVTFIGIKNRKIRTHDEINKYLKLGAVTDIPYCKADGGCLITSTDVSVGYRESCAVLCSALLNYLKSNNLKIVYVTSALNGEGKTTVSINLALSLSGRGKSVVLLDCDTRRPAVDRTLGMKRNLFSLQDVLSGKSKPEDALVNHSGNLFVMRTDITGLPVGAGDFKNLLNKLKESYDYIIIDTPPVGLVSDALVLNDCVDGVLFVIRQDYACMSLVAESVNRIKDSGAGIIGCVLNAKKKRGGDRYYHKSFYYRKINTG